MNWVIIGLVVLSMIGSVMWMMPTPAQRMQAAMRQKALAIGLKVQLVKLKFPRAKGQVEGEERSVIAYRALRHNLSKVERNQFQEWQIFQLETLATTGLPDGWSWTKGEGQHDEDLPLIEKVIADLPRKSLSLHSTGDAITLYWDENGNEQTVEQIQQTLQMLVEAKV